MINNDIVSWTNLKQFVPKSGVRSTTTLAYLNKSPPGIVTFGTTATKMIKILLKRCGNGSSMPPPLCSYRINSNKLAHVVCGDHQVPLAATVGSILCYWCVASADEPEAYSKAVMTGLGCRPSCLIQEGRTRGRRSPCRSRCRRVEVVLWRPVRLVYWEGSTHCTLRSVSFVAVSGRGSAGCCKTCDRDIEIFSLNA